MKNLVACASFVLAAVLAFVSLFLPPRGEIDSSVLVLIAQLLVLTATFLGVESYIAFMQQKFGGGGK